MFNHSTQVVEFPSRVSLQDILYICRVKYFRTLLLNNLYKSITYKAVECVDDEIFLELFPKGI